MTFRQMAARSRLTSSPQRASIIFPIIVLAALLAASTVNSTPASAQSGSPCDGLSTVTIDASPEALSLSSPHFESSAAANSDCRYTIEVNRSSSPKADGPVSGADCVISAEPEALPRGASVYVRPTGACSGIHVSTTIYLPNSGDDAPRTPTASSVAATDKTVKGKPSVFDAASIPIAWQEVTLTWTYDGQAISDSAYSTRSGDSWWIGQEWRNQELVKQSAAKVFAYDHIGWHSDGFPTDEAPDVDLDTRETVSGFGNGDGWCNGTMNATNVPDIYSLTWRSTCVEAN